jgi:hypothetical protein
VRIIEVKVATPADPDNEALLEAGGANENEMGAGSGSGARELECNIRGKVFVQLEGAQ